ncbi:hypothetical protein CANARDRAFT_178028 [[Candida] arabinofermentans NRRL YB-2248]|uniref:Probable electron transfer flavoprotein-ubiquinone oxidoreductase, mitochondrial n=1 Tax=[Candida] arabinofermentans NRRL YB-2248 TaxID=983967 RepID=A0A1E4SU17_9ASCO|nr:hypothetical protein CANARDRAFT_178028 [[Candida] arabinofermentans NRRL YB-2248]
MNKQASHSDSLYYVSLKLIERLNKIPGMKPYLELAFAKAEENAEQQAISLSAKNMKLNDQRKSGNSTNGNSGDSSSYPDQLLSGWNSTLFTFSAGILPAQIGYDPVTPLWKLFQQGAPLCLIFNTLSPENSIELVSSDDLKVCKMSVYKFLSACKMFLNVRDDELFPIMSVFSDDTNNLIKLIHAVNLILDFDPRFDAPNVEDQLTVSDSRSKVVKELVETERKFVQDLEVLFKYRGELIKSEYISSENINMLFPNLTEILDFQRRFLVGLECNAAVPSKYQRFGSVFLHPGEQGFKIYEPWSLFQNSAIEFINKEYPSLKKASNIIGSSYELQSFLIKPVQRICKYPMLLQELLKLTDPTWPNYSELHAAYLCAKEVANNINESQRKSENLQLVLDLQNKVVDWKGYTMINAGDLLFANVVIVKDLLTDGHSSEKEIHCYLFDKVIFFFKEIQQKNRLLTNRKKSTTSLSSSNSVSQHNLQLSLNGIVYINKIYRCTASDNSPYFANTAGHFLTLRWKGSKDSGGCVIKFKTEEHIKQWDQTIKRLSSDDEFYNNNSPNVESPYQQTDDYSSPTITSTNTGGSASRLSGTRSSSTSSDHSPYFLPKLRTGSSAALSNNYPPLPIEKKLRSVSSPASIMERNSPITASASVTSGYTLNSNLSNLSISQPSSAGVNIKLIYQKNAVHLSVLPSISFNDLKVSLTSKLNYSFGGTLAEEESFKPDEVKFKFKDEDGDFIRFQSDDDWLIAKEMLEEVDDDDERILNIKVQFDEMDPDQQEQLTEERAVDTVDVCIVGGGPAGLATAIRLKQLDEDDSLRVVVLEKAPDMGSHIVSGAILEPRALKELFPESEFYDDNGNGIPLPPDMVTKVEQDSVKLLFGNGWAVPVPEPPQMHNKGKNYIASLSEVVKYLSEKAEALGVEVYPNTSIAELVYDSKGHVKGVATKDMGISKDGTPGDSFERGMEFHARMTVLAEGCHGSLSKQVINKFNLREGKSKQTYGLGIKEVWEVKPENFKKGYVAHTLGYPLDKDTYGGGFQYHFGDGLVTLGLVVGLDYKNPWISPYQEFQKMKHHKFYKSVIEGGKCISYAARALNEGGYQSVPKLHFPGGVLVGASAGFMNVPKIKGSHTAMKSGMLAAECMYQKVLDLKEQQETEMAAEKAKNEEEEEEDDDDEMVIFPEWDAIDLAEFQTAYDKCWIRDELYEMRNVRPSFHATPLGMWGGLCFSGLITLITKGKEPFTLPHTKTDAEVVEDASKFKKIEYPKPDGEISFDIMTSVSRTGTYHQEEEQCHLRVPQQDLQLHAKKSYPKYKGIEQRFCPAGVYEYLEDKNEELGVKFQINSQNCIHCKTCDIKVPEQDINWTVPEGGDGPKYQMT